MTGGDGSLRTWVRGTARASEPTTCMGSIGVKAAGRAPKEQAASLWMEPQPSLMRSPGTGSTCSWPLAGSSPVQMPLWPE